MIQATNALDVFSENLNKTNMLIQAMEKIKAYNRIYQFKAYEQNITYGKIVEDYQNRELNEIEISCSEHVIISLTTIFETYSKDLLQQLLNDYTNYFQTFTTKHTQEIKALINDRKKYDSEDITIKLNLNNRFDFIKFYKLYKINFLTKEETNLFEYIYIIRNCYLHNGSKIDSKTITKLNKVIKPTNEFYLSTDAKRLRTKVKRAIPKIHERMLKQINKNIK